ncbi:twin-arginine translocation signal domain-containing protein, partial [bacterium LRH843]|nr:twin-arginine translocation signal domain-containing protein [bacterium LRH843]
MNVKNTPNVSRRAFLAGAGTTTAALTMGFAMLPLGMSAADAAGANMFSPSM